MMKKTQKIHELETKLKSTDGQIWKTKSRRFTGKSEAATTVARSVPITEWIPYVLQASAVVQATAIPELGISTSTATAWGNSQAHKNKGNIEVKR
nr:hypothetical protein Iba_chr09dCG9040 [Ipomoea batatas]